MVTCTAAINTELGVWDHYAQSDVEFIGLKGCRQTNLFAGRQDFEDFDWLSSFVIHAEC